MTKNNSGANPFNVHSWKPWGNSALYLVVPPQASHKRCSQMVACGGSLFILILCFNRSLLCIFVTGSDFFSCFLILFLQHWSFTGWNWAHWGAASRSFSLMLSDGKSHSQPLLWRGTDGAALSQRTRLAASFCLKFSQVMLAVAKVLDWWLHISVALRLSF